MSCGIVIECYRVLHPQRGEGLVLLKDQIDEAEYENLGWPYKNWYEGVRYRGAFGGDDYIVYYLQHKDREDVLEKVRCDIVPPPEVVPDPPPVPCPPPLPKTRAEFQADMWYIDEVSGMVFPFEISGIQAQGAYAPYMNRYTTGRRNWKPELATYNLNFDKTEFRYKLWPGPEDGSLGPPAPAWAPEPAVSLTPLAKPQNDPREDGIKGVAKYQDVKSGAVLPAEINSEDYHGKYALYQDRYFKMPEGDNGMGIRFWNTRDAVYGLDPAMIRDRSLVLVADLEAERNAARAAAEPPTSTRSRLHPTTYYKSPYSKAVLPKLINGFESMGPYKDYWDYYDKMNRTLSMEQMRFRIKQERIEREGWTVIDATGSPSSRGGGDGRERERERSWHGFEASAAPWPSVVDAVFAAHARAEARRRAAGAAARGERSL